MRGEAVGGGDCALLAYLFEAAVIVCWRVCSVSGKMTHVFASSGSGENGEDELRSTSAGGG